jgi:hypothetical protein
VSSNFSWTNDDALKLYCSYAGTCVTTIIYCAEIVQRNLDKIRIVLLVIYSSTVLCRKTRIRSLFASWSGCRETYVCYLIITLQKLYKLFENSVYWRRKYFFFVALRHLVIGRVFSYFQMRPLCSFETSRTTHPYTQHYIPEEWRSEKKKKKNLKLSSSKLLHLCLV